MATTAPATIIDDAQSPTPATTPTRFTPDGTEANSAPVRNRIDREELERQAAEGWDRYAISGSVPEVREADGVANFAAALKDSKASDENAKWLTNLFKGCQLTYSKTRAQRLEVGRHLFGLQQAINHLVASGKLEARKNWFQRYVLPNLGVRLMTGYDLIHRYKQDMEFSLASPRPLPDPESENPSDPQADAVAQAAADDAAANNRSLEIEFRKGMNKNISRLRHRLFELAVAVRTKSPAAVPTADAFATKLDAFVAELYAEFGVEQPEPKKCKGGKRAK